LSPELETLDQLLGGDMPLRLVRGLFADAASFRKGMIGLLSSGDVRLISNKSDAVPEWRWQEILSADEPAEYLVQITEAGGRKVS
jgi:hypothetical protein